MNLQVDGPAILPLQWGPALARFTLFHFRIGDERWIAAYTGALTGDSPVPLRIESACVFGHVMRSRQCDCGYQLEAAMREFAESGRGLLIYGVDQDARGLGTAAHFAIYQMRQQEGLDTAEVFDRLGAPVDSRSYAPVIAILRHLGVESVTLLTNNRQRAEFLRHEGIEVQVRPLEAALDVYNMSTLMLEKEDLAYEWSFETHADWLEPMQQKVDGNADLAMACVVVPGSGSTRRESIVVRGDPWSLSDQLAAAAPPAEQGSPLVAYLTDLPRIDELPRYRAFGADFVVVPFAPLPRALTIAGDRCGIRVVDWARRNAYRLERPQWTLAARTEGFHVYRRGSRARCLALGDSVTAAERLADLCHDVGVAPADACHGSGSRRWLEVDLDALPPDLRKDVLDEDAVERALADVGLAR